MSKKLKSHRHLENKVLKKKCIYTRKRYTGGCEEGCDCGACCVCDSGPDSGPNCGDSFFDCLNSTPTDTQSECCRDCCSKRGKVLAVNQFVNKEMLDKISKTIKQKQQPIKTKTTIISQPFSGQWKGGIKISKTKISKRNKSKKNKSKRNKSKRNKSKKI
jgi:hypothetical protein